MTQDSIAVLVVPAQGDPGGLLTHDQCLGGSPPRVVLSDGQWVGAYDDLRHRAHVKWDGGDFADPAQTALPLWWDNKLVPDGWDRLRRAVRQAHPWPEGRCTPYVPSIGDARDCAEHAVRLGLVSRVVLLNRVDGRLSECLSDESAPSPPRFGGRVGGQACACGGALAQVHEFFSMLTVLACSKCEAVYREDGAHWCPVCETWPERWVGGTDADPRPDCGNCGAPQPGWSAK